MRKGFKFFVICVLSLFTLYASSIQPDYSVEWTTFWDTFSYASPYSVEEEEAIKHIPEKYVNLFIYWAKYYNVSLLIAVSIATWESGFNPRAINCNYDANGEVWSIDRGIFQINSYYEPEFLTMFFKNSKTFDAFSPQDNIQVGMAIIKDLYAYFGDYSRTIRAFNIGLPTEANRWNVAKGDKYLASVMKVYKEIIKDLDLTRS